MRPEFSSSPRLLVVDDQEANLKIVGDMLRDSGFEIALASDGEQAMRRLEHRLVDLILLDVIMPDHDGLEICRRIRAHPPWTHIPIIFLSAADDKNLVVRALEMGGVDFVSKPFDKAELMSRVRTHVALKLARDQLKQLAEDKDELLGILAHDLKNHLGGMQMNVQLLQDRARLQLADKQLGRMAANIQYCTVQMLAFVEEFLANSAADRGLTMDVRPVCLNQITAFAVERYAEAALRKGIALKHEDGADASVAADPTALNQVLDNLISNALKFSPPGKSVRVLVEPNPRGGGVCRVQDEGPGFTEQDKTQMFHRYSRLSARPTNGEPSTGLGLSIAKKLTQAMGGQLECDSTAGQGATFTINLPGPNGKHHPA